MTNIDIFNSNTADKTLAKLGEFWKLPPYVEHFDARTIKDALLLLKRYREQAKIIAGGVDLVTLMRRKIILPMVIVNLKTIPGLSYIEYSSQGLKIGALTTIHDIEVSTSIREAYPVLADAAHYVASPQIKNMATIGGNLCQEVRCWYFRRSISTGRSFFCRRKGGDECYAVSGDNRYHAVVGADGCHAVCPSDLAPELISLDAKMKISGHNGDRSIPLEEFYHSIGNILQPDEIITEIEIPSPTPNNRQRYLKFRVRKTIDFAIVSVAAALTLERGKVGSARIVLGGVAPTPHRATAAEEVLRGNPLTENTILKASGAAVYDAMPLSMNRYKINIIRSLVKKALIE